jgi:hypothetical protein
MTPEQYNTRALELMRDGFNEGCLHVQYELIGNEASALILKCIRCGAEERTPYLPKREHPRNFVYDLRNGNIRLTECKKCGAREELVIRGAN